MYKNIPDSKVLEVLTKVGLHQYANHINLDMLINESYQFSKDKLTQIDKIIEFS